MNEREVWENFLNKLKIEKCYLRLKSIIKKNSISYDSLICRQIIFLYYIGKLLCMAIVFNHVYISDILFLT